MKTITSINKDAQKEIKDLTRNGNGYLFNTDDEGNLIRGMHVESVIYYDLKHWSFYYDEMNGFCEIVNNKFNKINNQI